MSDDLPAILAAELDRHHPRFVVKTLGKGRYSLASCRCCYPEPLPPYRGVGAFNRHVADALAEFLSTAALKVSADCLTGCMWKIPNQVEDMTSRQRELLERSTDA